MSNAELYCFSQSLGIENLLMFSKGGAIPLLNIKGKFIRRKSDKKLLSFSMYDFNSVNSYELFRPEETPLYKNILRNLYNILMRGLGIVFMYCF